MSDEIDTNGAENGFVLLENLGYNLAEFEIIPGRYFIIRFNIGWIRESLL